MYVCMYVCKRKQLNEPVRSRRENTQMEPTLLENKQPVPSMGKRRKHFSSCQKKKLQLLLFVGKPVICPKRGKTCMLLCVSKPEISVKYQCGKILHATSAKYGKTCNHCSAWANLQLVLSTGKHAISAVRGQSCKHCQIPENIQARCYAL